MSRGIKIVVGAVVGVVVLAVGAAWIYAAIDKPEKKPTLSAHSSSDDSSDTTAATSVGAASAASGDITVTWSPTSASVFQYRVGETLFGAKNTATGHTN